MWLAILGCLCVGTCEILLCPKRCRTLAFPCLLAWQEATTLSRIVRLCKVRTSEPITHSQTTLILNLSKVFLHVLNSFLFFDTCSLSDIKNGYICNNYETWERLDVRLVANYCNCKLLLVHACSALTSGIHCLHHLSRPPCGMYCVVFAVCCRTTLEMVTYSGRLSKHVLCVPMDWMMGPAHSALTLSVSATLLSYLPLFGPRFTPTNSVLSPFKKADVHVWKTSPFDLDIENDWYDMCSCNFAIGQQDSYHVHVVEKPGKCTVLSMIWITRTSVMLSCSIVCLYLHYKPPLVCWLLSAAASVTLGNGSFDDPDRTELLLYATFTLPP